MENEAVWESLYENQHLPRWIKNVNSFPFNGQTNAKLYQTNSALK